MKPIVEGETVPPVAECPEDIAVVRQSGVTPFPDDAVAIVNQDADYVTVDVSQKFSNSTPVDHMYLYYYNSSFNNRCFGWDVVPESRGSPMTTIDIKCDVLKPRAILMICVADDFSKDVLSEMDDALIPECCYAPPDLPPGTVCYVIRINCISECVEVGNELPSRERIPGTEL